MNPLVTPIVGSPHSILGTPHANRSQNAPRSAGSLTENGLISLNWVLTAGLQQLVGVKTHYEPPDIQQEILGAGDAGETSLHPE